MCLVINCEHARFFAIRVRRKDVVSEARKNRVFYDAAAVKLY